MDATDEMIRQRYLERVKQFPPERNADQFHKITEAYEAIKDRRSRVKSKIFPTLRNVDTENAMEDLVRAVKFTKKTTGLKALVKAAQEIK